jgi:hypothetical protein
MLGQGATVSSGSSGSLSYSGSIATNSNAQASIVPGQQYIVTIVGANTYASTVAVAS